MDRQGTSIVWANGKIAAVYLSLGMLEVGELDLIFYITAMAGGFVLDFAGLCGHSGDIV